MKRVEAQLQFDGKRLLLRNFYFMFFSLVMPAGFYLLFTHVLVGGSAAEIARFNRAYMGSMIVYSGAINALSGLSVLLLRDRLQGFLTWVRLTRATTWSYYLSIGFWNLVLNALAVGLMGLLAVGVNHVNLMVGQWGALFGVAVISMVPMSFLGVLLSFISRLETLNIVSELVTFPMAIMSGLWWPIGLLPQWLQAIGRWMPTYFANDWLTELTAGEPVNVANIWGLIGWTVGLGLAIGMVSRWDQQRGGGLATT